MSPDNRALALAAMVVLLLPAGIPATPDTPDAAARPDLLGWRDKPLRPMPASPLCAVAPRALGTAKVLAICIEFSNVKHDSSHTPAFFDNLADGPGNSMAAYFAQASTGKFTLSADSFGWYCSTQTMEHYGTPGGGQNDNPFLYKLVTEAVYAADPVLNFASYDGDGDGWVDYLQVVHSGWDEAMSGSQNDIWSEMYYDFDTPTVDGKRVGLYSMVSEYDPMGVFAHEFGHQIGLPDLYDTDYSGNGGNTDGAGLWDIMAAGAFLGNGDWPSLPCAWSRALLGWADVVTVTADRAAVTLGAAARNATVLRLNIPDIPAEYFLVECRSNTGFDSYLPGQGLLIWHIDDSRGTLSLNDLENRPGKKRVTLEEAHGGTQHLDFAGLKLYDPADPWSRSAGGFAPTSDPNSTADLDGRHSFISVRNIGPAGTVMTFDVLVDTPVYDLRLSPSGTRFDIDPGVTSTFSVELQNLGSPENYSFTIEGKSTEWFTVEPAWIVLAPRSSGSVDVRMRPPVTTPAGTAFEDSFRATPASERTVYVYFKFTVKVNAKQRSVFSPSQDIDLWPGEPQQIALEVRNEGNLADTVAMSIQGTGTAWVGYEGPMSFSLSAGSNATFTLRAAVPFGTEQNARAFVTVGGRSRDGSASVPATLNLTALSSPHIGFEGPPEVHARPGVPADIVVHLVNSGTADAVLELSASVGEGWWANLSRPTILIPAWGSEDVPVALTAPDGTPAGTLTAMNLTAAAGAYRNSTGIPVIVDQVFGAALEDCSTAAEVLPGVGHGYLFTLRNTGNGQDEMALELIEGEGGDGWSATVDQRTVRLGQNETTGLAIGVIAPAGATAGGQWTVRLSVRHAGRDTSLFDIVSTVARVRALTLSAAARTRAADPGETVQFALTASNAGNSGESVLFSAPKQDGFALEFSEPDYSLRQSEIVELRLSCRVQPGAAAGLRFFNITAAARDDPSVAATCELRLTVNANFGADLQMPRTLQEGRAGGSVVFSGTLVNTGNTNDTFTLSKATGTMDLSFDRATFSLAPGDRAQFNITLEVPADASGGPATVKLSCRSQGKPGEVALRELTVEVEARPGGAGGTPAFVWAAAGAAAIAIVVAAAWLLRRKKAGR